MLQVKLMPVIMQHVQMQHEGMNRLRQCSKHRMHIAVRLVVTIQDVVV